MAVRIIFFKNATIVKDKGRLGKCFRLKEAKEIRQPNVIPDPRLDSVQEGKKYSKNDY